MQVLLRHEHILGCLQLLSQFPWLEHQVMLSVIQLEQQLLDPAAEEVGCWIPAGCA